MSLFENDQYEWRETYFVLFDESQRPTTDSVLDALNELSKNFQVSDIRSGENGLFESLTIVSPEDYSAMDISHVSGEEVVEQAVELSAELVASSESSEEREMRERLPECSARLDIYHFEKTVYPDADAEDDLMDPGALLTVLQRLADLCNGIPVDPQSGILL